MYTTCFHCKLCCSEEDGKSGPEDVICMKTVEFSLILLDMFVYPVVFLMFDERESSVSTLPGEHVCPQLLVLAKVEQQIGHHLGGKLPSGSLVIPQ